MVETHEEKGSSDPGQTRGSKLAAKRAARAARKAAARGTTPVLTSSMTEKVTQATNWINDHARMLTALIIGGLTLPLAGIGLMHHLGQADAEAASLLAAGFSATQAPIIAEGETPPDDVDESYSSTQERANKALENFKALAKNHPGSAAAAWGRLGQANVLFGLGKYAEAQKAYALLSKDTDDDFVKPRAVEGLGFALEAQKKFSEAGERFEELSVLDGGPHKVLGDYHLARMLVAGGDKKKAIEVLEALVKSERERPADDPTHFEGVVADAETLLLEMGSDVGKPKLRADVPVQAPTPAQQGLTPEIIEALRKQLAAKEAQGAAADSDKPGLTKELLDGLEKSLDDPASTSTVIQVPANEVPDKAPAPSTDGTQ